MKRSLRAKEIALVLLPIVCLGGFAWYQQRVEQVGGSRRSDGLFVSNVEMNPAKGRFQAMGLSHEIEVTIGHSWPRPAWWGSWKVVTGSAPLLPISQQNMPFGFKPEEVLAYGGVLTTTSIQNGKPVVKIQYRDNRIGFPFRNNQIICSHNMALDKIPASAGEVTFQGLYLIAGREPLRITRVVRKAGEVSRQPPDSNPHGRILSIKAGAFEHIAMPPANVTTNRAMVSFIVARDVSGTEVPRVLIQSLELHDASGKIFKPYGKLGFTHRILGSLSQHSDTNTTDRTICLELAPSVKTTNPLILRGKLSIDDAWPIPFSVRLRRR